MNARCQRSIVHLDADAFFASVEQSADPRLRGKPIAVGGEKRGIIASASYEARKFGIYTPMPSVLARRLCPKLILLPGDFSKYELFSRLMFSYAYDFTPDVEIGSIDEGYFDLTATRKPPADTAQAIRQAIRQGLKLSVSEGIAANKLVSQIASKLKKPSAFEYVPFGHEAEFLSPLPNKWLPGIGPKTATQLNAAGLARVGQIAQTPIDLLGLLVGSLALQLRNFACGLDERPVIPVRAAAKSYGEQETFAADTTNEEFLEATLRRMADKLMAKVRADGKSIRTLTVKVRYNDMDEEQAGESLPEPTDLETDLYSKISLLLRKAWRRRVSLRLVSLKLSNIYEGSFSGGLILDISSRRHAAQQRLAATVDDLRQKFGRTALLRGHDFILRSSRAPSEEPPANPKSPPINTPHRQSINPRQNSAPSPINTPPRQNSAPSPINTPLQRNSFPSPINTPLQRGGTTSRGDSNRFSGLRLAVLQRQRIGNSFARASPAPELHLRIDPNLPKSEETPHVRNSNATGKVSNIAPSNFGFVSSFGFRASDFYLPLNLHSYYSFLDSTLSIPAIIDLAKRHRLPAVALTDKHNLHGAVEFAQAAAAAGIKPIIGAELDWHGHRLCLYVQNQTGYANLCRLLSSKAEGRRPKESRIPNSEIQQAIAKIALSLESEANSPHPTLSQRERELPLRRGLFPLPLGESRVRGIGTSKNPEMPISAKLQGSQNHLPSDLDLPTDGLLAVSPSPNLAQFFPGRFYLEINSLEALEKLHRTPPSSINPSIHSSINPSSTTPSLHHSLPWVASLPIHYALPSDRWKYDIVQSIRTLTLLRQQHPEKRLAGEYHFRPPAEMQRLFAAHPELLAHSLEIADRCDFSFTLGKPQFPSYPTPDGSAPAAFLRRLVLEGLRRRYPNDHARLQSQVEEELAIILEVGYEEYFLVMWDILQECRRRGIDWITRGSAADSLACYCLEISSVCPIRFDLYFRRFLNKERMALNKLPDIDVDFPHDRKDDVIDLIFEKYGPAQTAIVGGFSTFQSRSAFAEVAKVLGVSEFQVRRITERLPHFSRASELAEATADSLECRDLPLDQEPYSTALQMARFLDGFPRYPKMHPCGLVLSRQPMHEITPTFTSAKGYPTTHFDMDSIEAVGLIKMDILAQGGLAVMRDVEQMVQNRCAKSEIRNPKSETNSNEEISKVPNSRTRIVSDFGFGGRPPGLSDFPSPAGPFNDPAIWSLISSGSARAVHHIESPAMISLCKMCHVRDIDTLIAIVSVIRPGAANESKKMEFARRYQGLSPVRYPHPSLESCLRSTYGLVVYEEHILQICEAFAGLPPGRADVLRRALGKEKTELIDQIQIEFTNCARQRGRSEAEIAEVWGLVAGFRGYAFCKAHSTAYGVEAYQSAWLKLHYPAEFMAAVLTNGKGFYSPLVYVLECHRLGIPLLPPSVNDPGPAFKVEKSEIRVPLVLVKGLTLRTKETILSERDRAPFASLADFYRRVQPLPEEMDALIRVGAFDPFSQPRTAQYWDFKALYHTQLKSEIRNPKSETNPNREIPNAQNSRTQVVSNLSHSNFGFVSNFEFREAIEELAGQAYRTPNSPHPNPLPKGEGASLQDTQRAALPLPPGEGWGEGNLAFQTLNNASSATVSRNPKSETNSNREIPNAQNSRTQVVSNLSHSNFGFVSDFGFREAIEELAGQAYRTPNSPHPNPLPKGEGASLQDTQRAALPLPPGEGWGEGNLAFQTLNNASSATVSRNPKSETTSNREIPNAQNSRTQVVSNLSDSNFGFVSDFGFRISDLPSPRASQLSLLPPADFARLPSVPLSEPTRLDRLRAEEELLGYPASGHPLELYPDIAWDTYCPINRLGDYLGQQIVTCGLVIEQRLFHQVTGEPMKFITIADWTGIIETELFAKTYKSYGLNTIRYRVLEIAATVEPFDNNRGHTLRVLRAGKPRTTALRPASRAAMPARPSAHNEPEQQPPAGARPCVLAHPPCPSPIPTIV